MKLLTTLCLLILLAGCTQLILEKDRMQINTFLKSTEFDSAYYDPNGFFEVNKYKGIPSDVKLKYNPVTGTWEIVAESNSLERK